MIFSFTSKIHTKDTLHLYTHNTTYAFAVSIFWQSPGITLKMKRCNVYGNLIADALVNEIIFLIILQGQNLYGIQFTDLWECCLGVGLGQEREIVEQMQERYFLLDFALSLLRRISFTWLFQFHQIRCQFVYMYCYIQVEPTIPSTPILICSCGIHNST